MQSGTYCTVQTAPEETLTRRKMFYVGAHFLKSAIPDHSHAFHLLDHVYWKRMHHGVVNQAIFRVCVCVWDKKKNYIWNDSLRDNTMRLMSKKDVQLKKQTGRKFVTLCWKCQTRRGKCLWSLITLMNIYRNGHIARQRPALWRGLQIHIN